MEGTGTGAAAMLVGSAEDVGGRPDAATITLQREEIEEALASDAPLDLILSVKAGEGEPRDVRVTWQRDDLETVLGSVEAGPVTFSFDRAELYRALEHPDFEGHGMREIVLLVAAASSSAALMASTASAQVLDAGGAAERRRRAAVMPGHDEASTASASRRAAWPSRARRGRDGGRARPRPRRTHDEAARRHGDGQTFPATTRRSTASGLDAPRSRPCPDIGEATTARDLAATPAIHDEVGRDRPAASARRSPATTRRRSSPAASTPRSPPRSAPATPRRRATSRRRPIHDEAGATARGIGQTIPGNDEATLIARGIDPAIATAIGTRRRHDGTRPRDPGDARLRVVVRRCRRSTQERRRSSAGSRARACSSSAGRSPSVGSGSRRSDGEGGRRAAVRRRPSATRPARRPRGDARRPGGVSGDASATRALRRRGARRPRAPSTRPCACPCRSRRGRATCGRASRAEGRRGRRRAARREVERERQPLDERRVGGAAGLLLEPVRDERAEDAHLADAGAERHDERGGRARDEHPRDPREEPRAPRERPHDRGRDHRDALDTVGDVLGCRRRGRSAACPRRPT